MRRSVHTALKEQSQCTEPKENLCKSCYFYANAKGDRPRGLQLKWWRIKNDEMTNWFRLY